MPARLTLHAVFTYSLRERCYKRLALYCSAATEQATAWSGMSPSIAAPARSVSPSSGEEAAHPKSTFWALTIGSVGVVYGDIGTSPLYAFRESVNAAVGTCGDVSRTTVLGVLSLILWALIVIVTLKYVVIQLRADNNGEGGTLALMALAQ